MKRVSTFMEMMGYSWRRALFLVASSSLAALPLYGQARFNVAFPGLTLQNPVDLQNAGDGKNRLFVIEQQGRIIVFQNSPLVSSSTVFLDLTDKVLSGGEMGLLGLAFHPQFGVSGYFYVNYITPNPRRSVISRFRVTEGNPDKADSLSELILLTVLQPFDNHNGGQLAFGADGYLYIGLGDGGSAGDPENNAQNLGSLLGKILRIDVDRVSNGNNYAIPPDNPFVGNLSGFREEIWAYGLRNPWRFSFDTVTGLLWCGDVGQDAREEIDIIEKGKNYGWRIMEGTFCYNPSSGCNTAGLTFPVWDYGRDLGGSVTGGFVYRGSLAPSVFGKYVFGDFVSGHTWALEYDGINQPTVFPLDTFPAFRITSFGAGEDGELYLCSFDGKIYRLESSAPTGVNYGDSRMPSPFRLQAFPNPFNPTATLEFLVQGEHSFVSLRIVNSLGQEVTTLVEEEKDAGLYRVVWDASGLSSGSYYACLFLRGENILQTRKLILLR